MNDYYCTEYFISRLSLTLFLKDVEYGSPFVVLVHKAH